MRDPYGHLIEVGQTLLPGGWSQFRPPSGESDNITA